MIEYLFDGLIFAFVLMALYLSNQPKRTAIAVCLLVSVFAFPINELIPLGLRYSSLAVLESMSAVVLLYFSFGVSQENKKFFYLMISFLMVSVVNNAILIPLVKYANIDAFDYYTYCYQAIAIAHVLTMLAFSDVLGNTIRSIRDNFSIRFGGFYN